MKINNKTLIILLALFASITFTSCLEDGDFTVPESLGTEENANLNKILDSVSNNQVTLISIADLKNGYYTTRTPKEITGNLVVKGYVTSSDESGNFYKEFYMQDAPENPTSGIKVVLNLTSSHNKFNFGREVYIRLKGLYVGETRSGDGVVTVGGKLADGGDEVDEISGAQIPNHLFRSATTATIVPLNTTFTKIGNGNVGMFVKVDNAHFPSSLNGLPYFDPREDFDTQRQVEACDGFGYSTFILETSSFSNFGSVILPSGGGSISAVVSKDYNGNNTVLALNSVEDVDMNGPLCTPLDINNFTAVINEDFQSAVDNTNLDITGWVNFAEKGSELWTEQLFRGNGYAEFSGFRTGDAENVGWLISPSVDMNAHNNVYLNFEAAQHHLEDAGNTLEVLVSTDFDGTNVAGATWIAVEANIPTQSDSWYQFKDSGLIDLSSYTGTLYVAFKYTGSGTNTRLDGAYMIDNFKILAQ